MDDRKVGSLKVDELAGVGFNTKPMCRAGDEGVSRETFVRGPQTGPWM